MATVDLTDQEWQVVLSMIAMGPWRDANPVLMKIGDQLRQKQQWPDNPPKGLRPGNSGEEAGFGKLT